MRLKFKEFIINVNPFIKFIIILLFAISVLIYIEITFLILLFLIFLFLNFLFSIKNTLKFLFISFPFIFSIWFLNVLGFSCGETIFEFGMLKITKTGSLYSLSLALRIYAILLATYSFVSTINPKDFVTSLVQYLRLPDKFAFAIFIALRFFPIIRLTQLEAFQAYKQRGLKTYKHLIPILTLTIYTIFRKVNSLAISMETRGFGLYPRRVYWKKLYFSIYDIYYVLYFVAFLIIYLFLLFYNFSFNIYYEPFKIYC